MNEKRVFYARDNDDACDQIESIVDCICDFSAPYKITIEAIDAKDVPDDEDKYEADDARGWR